MAIAGPAAAATAADTTPREEWAAHWKLVFAAAVGASMASMAMASLGAFIQPVERAFGWTRAEISGGLTIYAVIGILGAPLFGRLVDRWGPRRFAVPGVLLAGAAFALFGTASASVFSWYALWLLFSIVAIAPKPMIWVAGVSSEFRASRGLAIALALTGGGLGSVIAPIVANALISALGWRLGYAVMGLGWGGIACVVCFLFFYGRSDRLGRVRSAQQAPQAVLPGVAAREGLRSLTFLKIAGATLLANSLLVALLVHMIPLLSEGGLPREEAVWLVGLAGFATIAGQIAVGAIADRTRGNLLAAAAVALPIVPCLLLLSPSTSVVARILPVFVQAVAAGAQVQMSAYLVTRYFGLRAYGVIYGVIASIQALTVGLGPLVAGYIHDRTGSYALLLTGGIAVSVVAALLYLSLGAYPDEQQED